MGPLWFLILKKDTLRDTSSRWKYVNDSTLDISVDNDAPDFSVLQAFVNYHEWATTNDVTINHKMMVMHINLALATPLRQSSCCVHTLSNR